MSLVLTPISLRQSLNMPSQSLKVPIFATLPGIIPLLHHIQPNCFQLCVMLNRVHTQLAAEARTLVPPKWQRCIHQSVSVNPHGSRFESTRDAVSFLYVARPYRPSHAVPILVRLFHSFVDVVQLQNRT